jgi:hypothetical protein
LKAAQQIEEEIAEHETLEAEAARKRKEAKNEALWRGNSRIERTWLQRARPTPLLYVPQVGDEVVYLPLGHESFLRKQRNMTPIYSDEELPPVNTTYAAAAEEKMFFASWPASWGAVLCTIEKITYSFVSKKEALESEQYNVSHNQSTFGSSIVQYRAGEIADDDLVPPAINKDDKQYAAAKNNDDNEDDDDDDDTENVETLRSLHEKASKADLSCAAADEFLDLCLSSSNPSTSSSYFNTGSLNDPELPHVYVVANLTLKFNRVRSSTSSSSTSQNSCVWIVPPPPPPPTLPVATRRSALSAASLTPPSLPDTFEIKYHPGLSADHPDFLLLRSRFEDSLRRVDFISKMSSSSSSSTSSSSSSSTTTSLPSVYCRIPWREGRVGWEESIAFSDTPPTLIPSLLSQHLRMARLQLWRGSRKSALPTRTIASLLPSFSSSSSLPPLLLPLHALCVQR